jgi:hypothetical protein
VAAVEVPGYCQECKKTYDRYRYETRETRVLLRGREEFRRASIQEFESIGEALISGFQAAKILRLLSA